MLRCKGCGTFISPSNPSANTRQHLASCSGTQLRRSPRDKADRQSDDEDASKLHSAQRLPIKRRLDSTLDGFTVKTPQLQQFLKHFSLFIYTSETPFIRINNPELQKAISVLGASLPDEKVFRTRLLDERHAEAQEKVKMEMEKLLQVGLMSSGVMILEDLTN